MVITCTQMGIINNSKNAAKMKCVTKDNSKNAAKMKCVTKDLLKL